MDDIVKAAMAKWPNVPSCFGWLGLDARGHWFMRDDATQAAGPFACQLGETGCVSKGSLLKHDKLIEFIQRNYACDEDGLWFFQNGPQRVYVELEIAPYIWRLQPDGSIMSHTGKAAAQVRDCLLDELGRLYLQTELGLGLIHTSDMILAADAVDAGSWQPRDVMSKDLSSLGRFVQSPSRTSQTFKRGI